MICICIYCFFFFKQKTAYEMRISDWSSDVCSSDLVKHIYVGNWFYGAFIVVTGMVHVINHFSVPVNFLKSYSMYSGATDAMIQWWYGHSVVGFILSVGFLGMMYYFEIGRAHV